ncbi:MAG: GYF domain-containing protein [Polyangiales bacterium]
MKFLCSNCKAKYQIADEKVAGRTLRMTCRRCKEEIVIHGEPEAPGRGYVPGNPAAAVRSLAAGPPPPPPPPPPSPLGAGFQMQVAGNVRPQPAMAMLDEWHVGINEVPVGPMRRDEIARKLGAGAISFDSLAWREGMDDWLPIGRIPELAVLLAPPAPVGLPPPPPVMLQPAQRMDALPLGGRAGGAPAYGAEDWAPAQVIEPPMSHSQMTRNPLLETEVGERRATALPSGSLMFALAGGFALLTAALSILGARYLSREQAAPASAPVAAAAPGAPVAMQQPAARQEPGSEMVISGDESGAQGQGAARRAAASPGSAQSKQPKKELTDAQKAMLARMTGGDTTAAPNLRPAGAASPGSGPKGSGGLTAEQVSKVVQHGKEMLQRCYETALRSSGSQDTVRLDVSVSVSAAGNVTSVKTGGQGLPGMNVCIERTVKMWRFPAGGEPTDTKFPVVFQPGG